MKLNRLAVGFAGVALGALVVTGVQALATVPARDGTITACVNSAGAPRIIDTELGQGCASGERRITWTTGWRPRGSFDSSQTYAAGDVVTAAHCSGDRLRMQLLFVRISSAPENFEPCRSGVWRQLSAAPMLRDLPVPHGFRVPANANDLSVVSRNLRAVRTWNYGGVIWLQIQDTPDATRCTLTATPVTLAAGVTVTRGDTTYKDWILLYTTQNGSPVRVPVDVLLDCPVN